MPRYFIAILLLFLFIIIFSCKKDHSDPNKAYTVYNIQNSGIPDNMVIRLAIDHNSNIWVGTLTKGIARFDGRNWITYNTHNSPLPNDMIWSLLVDQSNRLWIGTAGGLAMLDNQTWKVYSIAAGNFNIDRVIALCADSTGKIWAGGANNDVVTSGLASFDGSSWQYYNTSNSILPNNFINALAVDRDNTVWIGTNMWSGAGGLLKYKNGSFSIWNKNNSPLRYDMIDNISISKDNKLLISSQAAFFNNVGVLDGYAQEFDGVSAWTDLSPADPQAGLSNRVTEAVYDNTGNIWMSVSIESDCPTCDYALVKYDGQSHTVYSHLEGNFPRTFIPDIAIDKNNTIWVAAGDAGLIKMTP